MKETAAQILIDTLVDDWGVRHIFGLPGDGINGIMEALRQRKDDVTFVQVRHEEAAAFAACGYAKFTRGLGVCLATSGPGAIHLLNGLYDAKMDGASVLALTGQTYHDLIGTFYQQEVNLIQLFSDVAVYNHEVRSPAQVDALANEAVKTALARRGVAHISFPTDLQDAPPPPTWVRRGRSAHQPAGHTSAAWAPVRQIASEAALEDAARTLRDATRPAILVGAGALDAGDLVARCSEMLSAPVIHALLGKAVLPMTHPNHMGGVGLLGDRPGILAMAQCDTLLIVGSSFPYVNYYPKPGNARAVQIDVDPARIGLRYPVDVALPGDARATLEALLSRLQQNANGADWLEDLQKEKADWEKVLAKKGDHDGTPMWSEVVAEELNKHLPDNCILCADSGTNTTYYARHLDVRPGMMASGSGNLATMASGFPYAIGASFAFPDRRAVAFVGDGGFTMLMGEMLTAVKYKLPLVVVMLRNDYLAQIRWEQMAFVGNPEFGVELHNPHAFADWARNCGALGIKVEDRGDLAGAFQQAFANTTGPSLIECVVDPAEAPLPPITSAEQAVNFMRAIVRGQKNPIHIGVTMFRDKLDELLVQGVGAIPGPEGADGDGKKNGKTR
ncbi:MAG TPA: thiamine pyrophosphate-dependent enzyme [Gemmatimonadaceae bacterium]|nr:thiamine pyrophosphate-dependent enzyme [Gemmatimonadaceae bacterium]